MYDRWLGLMKLILLSWLTGLGGAALATSVSDTGTAEMILVVVIGAMFIEAIIYLRSISSDGREPPIPRAGRV